MVTSDFTSGLKSIWLKTEMWQWQMIRLDKWDNDQKWSHKLNKKRHKIIQYTKFAFAFENCLKVSTVNGKKLPSAPVLTTILNFLVQGS